MTWNGAEPAWNGGNAISFSNNDQWNGGGTDNVANCFNDSSTTNGFGGDDQDAGYSVGPSSGCFNCGEDGHIKADCPNPLKPREFTGTCNECGEVGHQARACPAKPKVCKQCNAENDHDTIDCKNKKFVDRSRVEDKSVDEAWAMLEAASHEVDIGDFRDAVQVLAKSLDGNLSFVDLEKECRKRGFSIYLIALKKDVPLAYTNVDLAGNVGKTHTIAYYTSASCPRPILMPMWPKDAAENLSRLEDVGLPMERGVPICKNCETVGHVQKDCPEEKREHESAKIICALCDEEGHRVRDCKQERPQPKERAPRACKICGSEDHIAKECENKPPETCHNCWEEGHRKQDCTNEKVFKCNNCDEIGHRANECKAPKDWSKHKCRHCGEFGHGSESRCDPEKKAAFLAAKEEDEGGNGGDFNADSNGFDSGTKGFESEMLGNNAWAGSADATSGGASWETKGAAPAAGGCW